MISFVISAASIVLAVIPILIIPENGENIITSLIQIQRADDIIHQNNPNRTDELWAYNKLQKPDEILNNPYKLSQYGIPKEFLNLAVLYYNKGDLIKALSYFNKVSDDKIINDNDSWYKMKIFSIERNLTDSNGPISNSIEDINCVPNRIKKDYNISAGTCNHSQLKQLNSNIKDLVQSGNTSDFSNAENNILSLQKPIEIFVNDLNYFIIGSIVTGPIIFFLAVKHIFLGK